MHLRFAVVASMMLACGGTDPRPAPTPPPPEVSVAPVASTAPPAASASASAVPIAPVPAYDWAGVYTASWIGGKNPAGGITPTLHYEITVAPAAGATHRVTIHADGWQTSIRMVGSGAQQDERLDVTYASCEPDDLYKCARYQPGDLLFSLVRAKGTFVLRHGKMTSPDEKTTELPAKRALR